jgi:hypothetical protein
MELLCVELFESLGQPVSDLTALGYAVGRRCVKQSFHMTTATPPPVMLK